MNCKHCKNNTFVIDNDLSGYVVIVDENKPDFPLTLDGNTEIKCKLETHWKCSKCNEPCPEIIGTPPPETLTVTLFLK